MRQIKFRAWSKKDKKMVDLYKITPLALDSALNMDGLFLPFTPELELMQFTGLCDKNGKEIFEGDIVETEWNNGLISHGKVEYCDGAFRVLGADSTYTWLHDFWSDMSNVKIIGTIHDKPELLEI